MGVSERIEDVLLTLLARERSDMAVNRLGGWLYEWHRDVAAGETPDPETTPCHGRMTYPEMVVPGGLKVFIDFSMD